MATPHPTRRTPQDDDMGRYLESLELDSLDLSGIDLGQRPVGATSVGLSAAALLLNSAALCVLPSTALYQLHKSGGWLFWGLLACEPVLLWLTRRLLQAWREGQRPERADGARRPAGQRAGADGAAEGPELLALVASAFEDEDKDELIWRGLAAAIARAFATRAARLRAHWRSHVWPRQRRLMRLAQKHRRLLLFAGIVGASLLLGFALPQDAEWAGKTYSGLWFVAVLVALTTGILVGRFVIAAGEASGDAAQRALPPIEWPPWVRWLSLALLVGGASFATFGPSLLSEHSPTSGFSFASVGFVVGIGGAIWLVRRFDEWEADLRQRAAAERQAPPPAGPGPDAENR